jgi:hypothetical protein
LVSKEIKKRILITVISLLFFIVTNRIVAISRGVPAVGEYSPIGYIIALITIIVFGTFLLNRYAASYRIYCLFAVLFLGLIFIIILTEISYLFCINTLLLIFIHISIPNFLYYHNETQTRLGYRYNSCTFDNFINMSRRCSIRAG